MENTKTSAFRCAINRIHQRRQGLLQLVLVVSLGRFLSALAFMCIDAVYQGRSWAQFNFDFNLSGHAAVGATAISLVVFVIELYLVGWERSSIKKLLAYGTSSQRQDVFYTVLYLTNILTLVGHIMSLGAGYMLHAYIQEQYSASLFGDAGIWVSVGFLWLIGPLLFYFYHRIQHTAFFWEFHKTHHSASEMTILNNFRNHPLTASFREAINFLPMIILGVDPIAILIYRGTAGLVTLWQHSNYYEPLPWVEKYLFIGARGHLIHHSIDEKHLNTNMGFVVFWDWLFGTLNNNYTDKITVGLSDEPNFNTHTPAKEVFSTYILGLKSFYREVSSVFSSQ